MSVTIHQHSADRLYVPVHRRSPSASSTRSSQGSWRAKDTDDVISRASTPRRLTYSISDLLLISSSPLARLSEHQIQSVHEHLYLPFALEHPRSDARAPNHLFPVQTALVAENNATVVRRTKRDPSRGRSASARRSLGGPANFRNKRRNGWGYSVHTTDMQDDWRHLVHVPTVGA